MGLRTAITSCIRIRSVLHTQHGQPLLSIKEADRRSGTVSDDDGRCKLIIIGDANTGKSSLVGRFVGKPLSGYVGLDVAFQTVELDGVKTEVVLWDTAGQERYRPPTPLPYLSNLFKFQGIKGVVIVYSVIDVMTFRSVPNWIQTFGGDVEPGAHIKTVLVGNKCDRVQDKVVDYATAVEFASERQIPLFEVSAKDGTNVELLFMTLVAQIRESKK